MSGKRWMIRLGALAALCGGVLGILLVTQGTNSYGNYGWHGWMAPVAASLFALGLAGAMAVLWDRLDTSGRFGIICCIAGMMLMGIGHAFEAMWAFIFIGPLIIVPIGAILLGINIHRRQILPAWWRWFAVAIVAIAIVGFGVEILEGIAGNSTPDRGVQLAEALFSCTWIGLGVGLWLQFRDTPDDPQLAA